MTSLGIAPACTIIGWTSWNFSPVRKVLSPTIRSIFESRIDGLLEAVPEVDERAVLVGRALAPVDDPVLQRDRVAPGSTGRGRTDATTIARPQDPESRAGLIQVIRVCSLPCLEIPVACRSRTTAWRRRAASEPIRVLSLHFVTVPCLQANRACAVRIKGRCAP